MDVGDLGDLRPRLRGRDGRHHAVGRLDVGQPKDIVRIGHGLFEQEVRASIREDGQALQLLGDGTERRRVAAGDDAGEAVDVLRQLHAAQLLDVGVRARGLVRFHRLDLALAEQSSLRVDLLGGEDVSLVRLLAEHGCRTGEEGHVTGLVRLVGDRPLGWHRRLGVRGARQDQRAGGCADGTDRHADPIQEITTTHLFSHRSPFGGGCERCRAMAPSG